MILLVMGLGARVLHLIPLLEYLRDVFLFLKYFPVMCVCVCVSCVCVMCVCVCVSCVCVMCVCMFVCMYACML